MNPKIPTNGQFLHDAFFTLLASLQAAGIEIFLCFCWSNNHLKMKHFHLSEAPWLYAILALTITHWRIPHFYVMHRFMHPWKVIFGRFLVDFMSIYVDL